MLFRYNLDTDNEAIQRLLAETSAFIGEGTAVQLPPDDATDAEATVVAIAPFIAVDHEGGSVSRFLPGVADLPHAASYWELAQSGGWESAIAQIHSDSFNAGLAIGRLGVNLNFAPVAEHLNDDNRDFLQIRSYGPDPDFVAKAAAAFTLGMYQAGVLCSIKHFPGSAGADPHYYPSVLGGDRAAMAELAFPFAALVQDGHARAIMVSHSAIPAWDSENIASLSPTVMETWLRGELGFAGIIICDDFSMAAARGPTAAAGHSALSPEAAAVLSLAAGSDMVMVWPPDLRRTHRAIQAALNDGRLSRQRLREAAQRILFEKLRMGLIQVTGNSEQVTEDTGE